MKGGKLANSEDARHNRILYSIIAFLVLILILVLFSVSKIKTPELKIEEAASVTMWSINSFDVRLMFASLFGKNVPDLAVLILSAGYIDEDGMFVQSETLSANTVGALRVQVKNEGNKASSVWHITAELPTQESYTYISENQPSLGKGEEKTFLLTFDHITTRRDKKVIVRAETLIDTEKDLANNTAERDFSEIE